ncbi:MAG: fused response regulator/phosphatase [Pseudomonadota bacterium]
MNEINPIESPASDEPLSWEYESITNSEAPHLVLVVDDSAMQRKMVTKALLKWGYEVIEADSALKGLELCKSHDVTMVISDWMMPGMNGPEFCHAFRQLDREGYGYFILLTSKGESREVAAGLNSGADDFLIKPFVFGELKARLRAGERIVEMHSQLVHKNKIVNQALDTIRTLYDSVQSDLVEARRLQASLVRERHVEYANSAVSMMLHPSGHVGGDLVGQFAVSEHEIGIYSLDVSGHGVASALMAARLAGYLSGLSPSQNIALIDKGDGTYAARDPSETAALLNETLLRELETDHYFTMALAIINTDTGEVKCTQAGHPHPLIRRANGTTESIGVGGMPVGLIPGAAFESFDFTIAPGDAIFLFSDGLTEAEDPNGEQLEEAGLEKLLSDHRALNGTALLDTVYASLQDFCQNTEFADDVSALVFELTTS